MNEVERLLTGSSVAIQRVRARIVQFAESPLPIIVRGPTGSGKELVAHAIHIVSRRSGRFVPFNVSSIPEAMFADAVFGHVRGAFTNAISSTPGFAREAHDGTLFMDEISRLPLSNQVTLLRAIETHVVRPLGGTEDRSTNFRVVSATNEDLRALVASNAFREDLYFRLHGAEIVVPPLRDRREDIFGLSHMFAASIAGATLTPAAVAVLERHSWPGNVRELKSVVESAAYQSSDRCIGAADVQEVMSDSLEPGYPPAIACDRSRLVAELLEFGGDVSVVADRHGVHRGTVYRWMREHSIPTPARRQRPSVNGLAGAGARDGAGGLQSRDGVA